MVLFYNLQEGAEHLGSKDDFADVEIMLVAYEILKTLKPNVSFKVRFLVFLKFKFSILNFADRNQYFGELRGTKGIQ